MDKEVYVEHIASEMKDLVQECIMCGTTLTDYRGAMVLGGGKPVSWPIGPVYVSKKRNPTIFTIEKKEYMTVEKCTKQ